MREGVLLLEHAEKRERFSQDEYAAAATLRDAPRAASGTVVFANAAAKRMLHAEPLAGQARGGECCPSADVSGMETCDTTGAEAPAPPPVSGLSRKLSEESFVPRPPRSVEGLDLVRAFPGPPETAVTLERVSELLAQDAARRRSHRAGERSEVCENTEALMQGKARKEHSTKSLSLARSESTKSMLVDSKDASLEAVSGERDDDDAGYVTPLEKKRGSAVVPLAPVEIDADFVDGRRRVELSFTNVPMDALGCPATLVHVRDVTEEHESRRLLMCAKVRSDAAVEAKSSFLANTSHEIRTPLNAIIAGSELLGEISEGMSGDQVELVDMVTRAGKSLLTIVNDVLDFSKIEADKLTLEHRPFVLENCVDLSFEMQSIKANAKELVLNYSIDDSVPWGLVGDEARLRQVVTNLISNAVKFTPERGSVVLRVRALEEDEDTLDALYATTATRGGDAGKRGRGAMEGCAGDDRSSPSEELRRLTKCTNRGSRRLSGSRGDDDPGIPERAPDVRNLETSTRSTNRDEGGKLRASKEEDDRARVRLLFEVTDTGTGLSSRDRASLFTAFEQVNKTRTRREGGTGLGLVISMRLVRLMGGDMAVTSEGRGKGSRFAFVVRLRRRDEPPKKQRSVPKKGAEKASTRTSSFDGRRSLEGLAPSSGVLRGRRVDVISTCASFCHSADFFISGAGLETYFPSPEEVAETVGAAAEPRERRAGGDRRPRVPRARRSLRSRPVRQHAIGSRRETERVECGRVCRRAERGARRRARRACTNARRAASPPSVLVLTFSQNACDVGIPGGASVSVVTKPLVNGKFQRWVEGLVARHAGDAANGPANARWDAKHASLREGGASVADASKFQFGGGRALSRPFESSPGVEKKPLTGGDHGSLQKRGSLVNLAALETHAEETEVWDLDPEAKRRVRVLLAEDNAVNQKIATKILHALGFVCAVAVDGEQAVARFVEHAERGESFDVVLMDLQMPVMDGMEAARAILSRAQERVAKPKIFALTADVATSVIEECRDAGMDGFLGKPIDRVRLGRVMRDVTKWVTEGRPDAFHAERTWEVL